MTELVRQPCGPSKSTRFTTSSAEPAYKLHVTQTWRCITLGTPACAVIKAESERKQSAVITPHLGEDTPGMLSPLRNSTYVRRSSLESDSMARSEMADSAMKICSRTTSLRSRGPDGLANARHRPVCQDADVVRTTPPLRCRLRKVLPVLRL